MRPDFELRWCRCERQNKIRYFFWKTTEFYWIIFPKTTEKNKLFLNRFPKTAEEKLIKNSAVFILMENSSFCFLEKLQIFFLPFTPAPSYWTVMYLDQFQSSWQDWRFYKISCYTHPKTEWAKLIWNDSCHEKLWRELVSNEYFMIHSLPLASWSCDHWVIVLNLLFLTAIYKFHSTCVFYHSYPSLQF